MNGSSRVRLRSINVRYDTTTLIFGFDANVTNLLTERMDTPDGTTVSGIKVFYESGPSATSFNAPYDTGTVSGANADGRQSFTKANQPYHFYDQALAPGDSTPFKRWELRIPRSVSTFSFVLEVFAHVAGEPAVPEMPSMGFLIPADSVTAVYSAPRAVFNHPRMSGPYPRNVILLSFRGNTTSDERQAAVNTVGGTVIGGFAGIRHIVIVPGLGSGDALWAAIDTLRRLPQVEDASPDVVTGSIHAESRDGPGLLDDRRAAGSNRAAEAISAPSAWRCSTEVPIRKPPPQRVPDPGRLRCVALCAGTDGHRAPAHEWPIPGQRRGDWISRRGDPERDAGRAR